MADDDSVDHEPYLLSFPVWVVVDEVEYGTVRLPASVQVSIIEDGLRFIPLFTDDDLAQQFITDASLSGKVPLALLLPRILKDLLKCFGMMGVDNAGIDVSLVAGKFRGVYIHTDKIIGAS